MVLVRLIGRGIPSIPIPTGRTDNHGDQAEDHVGGNNSPYLTKGLGGPRIILGIKGIAQPPMRDSDKMAEQGDHQQPGALHDVNMNPGIGEPTGADKNHGVSGANQSKASRAHPGEEPGKYAAPEIKPLRRIQRSFLNSVWEDGLLGAHGAKQLYQSG